jgi:hypothetical protein
MRALSMRVYAHALSWLRAAPFYFCWFLSPNISHHYAIGKQREEFPTSGSASCSAERVKLAVPLEPEPRLLVGCVWLNNIRALALQWCAAFCAQADLSSVQSISLGTMDDDRVPRSTLLTAVRLSTSHYNSDASASALSS